MKKLVKILAAGALALSLAACSSGSSDDTSSEDKTITIGATSVPHAEILNDVVADLLAEDGWTLEVTTFNDYVQPNTAVEDEELDANYFQTLRYMDEENEERDLHLVAVAGIHLEPMGAYSKKYTSVSDIPDGAEIAIPNDGSNESRALKLLEDNGLITLDSSADLYTPADVTDNPHNFTFVEQEAASLPRTLDDVDLAIINGNYALEADLNPTTDALFAEASDTEEAKQYINYLVVKEGNEETDKTKALIKALQSDEVKAYIEDTYEGSVIPAFVDPAE